MIPTEQAIINAALKLFSEKGYEATSIRDIADEAEIKSATLYYYVKNKKELLVDIMDNYLNQLKAVVLENIDSVEKSEDQVKQLIKIHVENHGREKLAALVVDNEYRSLEGEDREKVRQLRKAYENLWIEILEKGKSEGKFHFEDSKITSFALIGLCTGVAHWYKEGGRYTLDEVAEQYADYGLKMIGFVKEDM